MKHELLPGHWYIDNELMFGGKPFGQRLKLLKVAEETVQYVDEFGIVRVGNRMSFERMSLEPDRPASKSRKARR